MVQFWRKGSKDSELPKESQVEFQKTSDKRWPILAVYIVAALIIATGVVFGARWLYHTVSNSSNDNSSKVTTQQDGNQKKAPSGQNNGGSSDKSSGNKSSGGSATPPRQSGSKPSGASAGGTLPNNGPGDVAALFVGTSFVAGGLHYYIARRKRLVNY